MKISNNYGNLGAGMIGLTGVVMFSAKSVFAKMAFAYRVDPIAVLYMRMLFAFPLVLMVGFWYEKTRKQSVIIWKDILKVVAISILGYYISALFNFIGLVYIDASLERLLLFSYPTMVIVLSAIFLKRPVTMKQILAICLAYAGLFLAFADKISVKTSSAFWIGVLLIMASSFTYAIFLTVSDDLIKRVGSVRFTTTATLTMSICMIIHALFAGVGNIEGYNSNVYWYCILMAVFSTVIPVYLFNYSMSRIGASNVSIISCFGPVCTIAYSAMLLNEVITMWQIAGTLVVILGIFIIHKE
jgi:drug/metabolite transporter (DMT)-like permease